jgi:carbonic anhydrase
MLMKKSFLMSVLLASSVATHAFAHEDEHAGHAAPNAAPHAAHWAYDGAEGPDHWGDMEAKFSICSAGKNQSPVNLTDFVKADLAPLKFDYQATGNQVLNNGHTIQVNYAPGSTLTLKGHSYELKQFHAHAPSENQINGKNFAMEVHFVHADANGSLAVVAVMFEEGKANAELEKAWKAMPHDADQKVILKENVLGTALMPEDKAYYRFNGSLTTPPCTEGVTWLVLKTPVTASKEQIDNFAHVMHHHNNRPVQAINARVILE